MNFLNLTTVCRLCLKDSINLSVFDNNHSYLPQKILACIGIEVKENDKMSKMICKYCLKKVEEYYDFRNTCHSSQFMLMNWAHSADTESHLVVSDVKNEVSINVTEIIDDDLIFIKDEPIDADHSTYEFINIEKPTNDRYVNPIQPITEHTLSMLEDDSLLVPSGECPSTSHGMEFPPEVCQYCNKIFCSSHNRLRHERTVHQIFKNKVTEIVDVTSSNEKTPSKEVKKERLDVKCKICKRMFSSYQNRIRHERTVHEDTEERADLFCKYCQKEFTCISSKLRHVKIAHKQRIKMLNESENIPVQKEIEIRPVTPKIPPEKRIFFSTFKIISENDFVNFYNKMSEIFFTTLVCLCCNEIKSRKTLSGHLKKIFPDDFRFNCFKCWVSFPNMSQFRTHTLNIKICNERNLNLINNTLNVKPYQNLQCQLCEFLLVNEQEYDFHFIKHKPVEFPKPCYLCYENLETVELYKEHYSSACVKRIHCGICKNNFISQEEFNVHCDTHVIAEELSFDEKISQLYFTPDATLDNQVLVNDPLGNDTLENGLLLDELSDKEALNQSSTFRCRLCLKDFEAKIFLLKHLRIYHKDSSIEVCNYCPDKDVNKYVLKIETSEHMKNFHNEISENNFSCNICGSLFSTLDEWRIHQKFHLDGFKCEECDDNFENHDDLNAHKIKHQTKLRLKIIRCSNSNSYRTARPRRNSIANQFSCRTCDQYFSSKSDLEEHMHVHKNSDRESVINYECKICDKTYRYKELLERHNKEHHNRSRSARAKSQPPERSTESEMRERNVERKCPICNFVTKGSSSLYFHNKKYHSSNKSLPILADSEIFKTENLKTDQNDDNASSVSYENDSTSLSIKSELIDNRRKCPHCDFIAKASNSLYHHKLKFHTEVSNAKIKRSLSTLTDTENTPTKELVCEYCNLTCKSQGGLTSHMKIHTEDRASTKKVKLFTCINCHTNFTDVETLQDHILTHFTEDMLPQIPENKKLYPCIHCHKLCLTACSLTNHSKIHEKRKKYKCTRCGKICLSKGGLAVHLKTYCLHKVIKKPKSYACRLCPKRFLKARGLGGHMKLHTRPVNGILKNDVTPLVIKKKLGTLTIKKNNKNGINLTCKKCKIKFSNEDLLKVHLKNHVKEEKHKQALLEIKEALSNDKKSPSGNIVEEYKCEKCPQVFDKLSSFISHRGWHLRGKETTPHVLKRHYKCKHCKLIFSQSSAFKKHILKHKKISCTHCPKHFTILGKYRRHLRIFHNVELQESNLGENNVNVKKKKISVSNYSCMHCNISFPDARRLRIHMLKHEDKTE